jgi:hypothetical protein
LSHSPSSSEEESEALEEESEALEEESDESSEILTAAPIGGRNGEGSRRDPLLSNSESGASESDVSAEDEEEDEADADEDEEEEEVDPMLSSESISPSSRRFVEGGSTFPTIFGGHIKEDLGKSKQSIGELFIKSIGSRLVFLGGGERRSSHVAPWVTLRCGAFVAIDLGLPYASR